MNQVKTPSRVLKIVKVVLRNLLWIVLLLTIMDWWQGRHLATGKLEESFWHSKRPILTGGAAALLEAEHGDDDFLDNGIGLSETIAPISVTTGSRIGRYKLLQQLGEGGFGVVYMAEQLEPVNRQVAIKIIKPGMDSQAVIARFEAERQALAMMDHPHIAKVLDGGTTPEGRPYFVMELVRGVSITEFCDKRRLASKERLGLLVDVCHAVQHAHRRGIIHRDRSQ